MLLAQLLTQHEIEADEFIDAAKVTAVVEGDPGICAKLLGLANSAYFGLAEPVNNIGEAISRVLGVDTVRSLVLAMAIQNGLLPESDAIEAYQQRLAARPAYQRASDATWPASLFSD